MGKSTSKMISYKKREKIGNKLEDIVRSEPGCIETKENLVSKTELVETCTPSRYDPTRKNM